MRIFLVKCSFRCERHYTTGIVCIRSLFSLFTICNAFFPISDYNPRDEERAREKDRERDGDKMRDDMNMAFEYELYVFEPNNCWLWNEHSGIFITIHSVLHLFKCTKKKLYTYRNEFRAHICSSRWYIDDAWNYTWKWNKKLYGRERKKVTNNGKKWIYHFQVK